MPTYWETDKIRLRSPVQADALQNVEQRRRNDDENDWLCDQLYPPSPLEWMLHSAEQQDIKAPEGDDLTYVIETLEGEGVGSVSVSHCDARNGTFGYGLAIGAEHRRKGYGADALRLVLGFYFNELRYHKCNITIYSFNHASIAFHRAFGFVEEGRDRESLYSQGKYHDVLRFGMTAEEFGARHAVNWLERG